MPRNVALGSLLELFLVAAVASLLGIRAALALSGFPKLGGGGLHIAHMLWGGLFMLVSLLILLTFIGRLAVYVAAFLGGVGFGTFIDELGKFTTSDNDYFFRPAIAIIYVIFVLLFILARALESRRRFSNSELLANAFDAARDATLYRRRAAHSSQLLAHLGAIPGPSPIVAQLRDTLAAAEASPPLGPSVMARLRSWLGRRYSRAVSSRKLGTAILCLFTLYAVVVMLSVLLVAVLGTSGSVHLDLGKDGVDDFGIGISNAMTTILIVIGAFRLRHSRLAALRWFRRAVLVDLLLARIFIFYQAQFAALFGISIDLLLLLVVSGVIRFEESRALPVSPRA
ncbi:MAG: hypothetical protein JF888_03845 [Candidatus Dormibacteraeota bacterium]|uniref:Uncharacterized protein n=1 Tax=Candidatus Dormiibacter inghamiae TaxID=3127013 RepID=A0A934NCV7_9BACT|nr:hypothetical protein [Candidatus Dormibacteraeota bacterium]MBJ7604922.1 hypothetical protein [Candidatus Dormibacteraeota bacterium]